MPCHRETDTGTTVDIHGTLETRGIKSTAITESLHEFTEIAQMWYWNISRACAGLYLVYIYIKSLCMHDAVTYNIVSDYSAVQY